MNSLIKYTQAIYMIYLTIFLIFMTLMLLPFRLHNNIEINFDQLSISVKSKLWFITVFKERLYVEDGKLKYQGSINGIVEQIEVGKKGNNLGARLVRSINVETLDIENFHNIMNANGMLVHQAVNIFADIALTVLSLKLPDCKAHFSNVPILSGDNNVKISTTLYVTPFALTCALFKEV